jgi:hypothetical protein
MEMMKNEREETMRATISIMAVILLLGFSQPAFSCTQGGEKLKKGLCDLLTSPAGFFTHTSERVSGSDDKLFGLFYGIAEGADSLVGKSISGVVNILTFPIPNKE